MTTLLRPEAGLLVQPETRIDGPSKVTGTARYLADRLPADTLWMAVTRSPFAHARVVSVSVEAAWAMPGVRAILTGADLRGVRIGRRLQDMPILAWERVRFIGDRVAAVAADTAEQAAAAAAVVDVEYEELAPILTAEAAAADGAPILHPDAASYRYLGPNRPPAPHPNLQGHSHDRKGAEDIEAIFAAAHRVFEHDFVTLRQHHGYLEPHGASAWVESDGLVHVLTTNKSPFALRGQLASSFAREVAGIVVDSAVIGGDFGGKGFSIDEGLCMAFALETGRPVSSIMSYADELQAANPRHGAHIRLRSGVDRAGRIIAHQARFSFEGGAYAAAKPMPLLTPPGPTTSLNSYDIENVQIEVSVWYTNTVPAGHMRNPGEVQAAFAGESHIDMIARDLGMDPLEFRMLNAARPGTSDVLGRTIKDPRVMELLELVAEDREHRYRSARAGEPAPTSSSLRRGHGVALTGRHMEGGRMSVRLRGHTDGMIEIRTGIPDQGGGAHTMMLRVAATALDLPLDRFRLTREMTDTATFDLGVGASRVTYVGSQAVAAAAETFRQRVVEVARASHGERDGVTMAGDRMVRSDGSMVATLDEVLASTADAPIETEGTFDTEVYHDAPQDFSFAAYSVDVEVDERTGAIRVVDAFLAGDAGTIINPLSHHGQVNGGFAFGIGAALLEELAFDDGMVTTAHLGDYKLPTIQDVPPLRSRFVNSEGGGAFGAKMAGELSVSGVAPAIANAVADAVGGRVSTLPLSPERVLASIGAADG